MNTYADEITNFLLEEENFLLALDVEEHLQEAKDRLHREFWETLRTNVVGRLPDEGWSVELDDVTDELGVSRGYFGMDPPTFRYTAALPGPKSRG